MLNFLQPFKSSSRSLSNAFLTTNTGDPTQLHTTEALILRKTEYSETSLVTAVLTRDLGQQHFIFKGARKGGKKRFPIVDLFRRLRIVYKPSARTELNSVRDAEILQTYDAIALNPDYFRTATWLSQFILKNTQGNMSVPNVFQALNVAFSRLSSQSINVSCLPIVVAVCFVMISESGLLPDYSEDSNYKLGCKRLIDFALNADSPVPSYPESSWNKLGIWTRNFIVEHTDLKLPDRAPL